MNFRLPVWAFWSIKAWKENKDRCGEIFDGLLGWDITDFGKNDFYRYGLLLFTIRNGNIKKNKKPYAEKIMIAEVGQETPMHFHWHKMEDIINRGGGDLVIEPYNSTKDEGLSKEPVILKIDGIESTFNPGEKIILKPGESISLEQGIYHRFYAEKEKVLMGEVSMVNDDNSDNRFYQPVGRFPEIEEDEKPLHLLVNDYQKILGV